jgi:hypothetical protein
MLTRDMAARFAPPRRPLRRACPRIRPWRARKSISSQSHGMAGMAGVRRSAVAAPERSAAQKSPRDGSPLPGHLSIERSGRLRSRSKCRSIVSRHLASVRADWGKMQSKQWLYQFAIGNEYLIGVVSRLPRNSDRMIQGLRSTRAARPPSAGTPVRRPPIPRVIRAAGRGSAPPRPTWCW